MTSLTKRSSGEPAVLSAVEIHKAQNYKLTLVPMSCLLCVTCHNKVKIYVYLEFDVI